LSNDDAGKLRNGTVVARAWGKEDPPSTDSLYVTPTAASFPLTLQRMTTFGASFDASPEPVKKGKAITVKGTLTRVNWNGDKTLKYAGYAKANVQVQFRADGAAKYTTLKTVSSGKVGKVATSVRATRSGRWRLAFAGISTSGPATSTSDIVKVK
jgi:hypothetical protein